MAEKVQIWRNFFKKLNSTEFIEFVFSKSAPQYLNSTRVSLYYLHSTTVLLYYLHCTTVLLYYLHSTTKVPQSNLIAVVKFKFEWMFVLGLFPQFLCHMPQRNWIFFYIFCCTDKDLFCLSH